MPDPDPEVTKTCIYLEFRYSDGSREWAEGDAARQAWDYIMASQTMNWIHGARYTGPSLNLEPAKEPSDAKRP